MWKQLSSYWEKVYSVAFPVSVTLSIATAILVYVLGYPIIALIAGILGSMLQVILWYARKRAGAPRCLSKRQQQLLISKLKPFAGTFLSIRVLIDNNPDAIPLSEHMGSILGVAGWQPHIMPPGMGENVLGIIVTVSNGSDAKTSAAARILIQELNSDGIMTVPGAPPQLPNDQPNVIRMTIGIKP